MAPPDGGPSYAIRLKSVAKPASGMTAKETRQPVALMHPRATSTVGPTAQYHRRREGCRGAAVTTASKKFLGESGVEPARRLTRRLG